MHLPMRTTDHRTLSLLDGVVAFWVVLWAVVAGLTGFEIWSLSRLSDTAEISAVAADSAGEALQGLSEIPLVGDEPGELGTEVRAAAADIVESAARTREQVRQLSVLLGVAIFAIPVSPVVCLYLPLRLRHRSYLAEIRRAFDSGADRPALEAYLAHSALAHMGFTDLSRVSRDPASDVAEGRHAALAAAELERLGLASGSGR